MALAISEATLFFRRAGTAFLRAIEGIIELPGLSKETADAGLDAFLSEFDRAKMVDLVG